MTGNSPSCGHPSYKCIRTLHLTKSQNSLFEARGRHSSLLVIRILVDTENDKVILHEVLAEGTNIAIARSPIASLVYNNILIVKTIAEYCKLFKNDFLFQKNQEISGWCNLVHKLGLCRLTLQEKTSLFKCHQKQCMDRMILPIKTQNFTARICEAQHYAMN